jgi:hypothetical protein
MIIAPNVVLIGRCRNDALCGFANNNETPIEQGVSLAGSLRKCNLLVRHDYVKRLSTLAFRNYAGTLSRGESSFGRSTIPMK